MKSTRLYPVLADLLVGRSPAPPLDGTAEWGELAALAQAEGVAPLLHRALAAVPGIDAPPAVTETLAAEYMRAFYASVYQQSLRARLCRSLEARSIPVLLLKGAALAYVYYDDPATRPMADLDLLVPRSQLEEAARGMESAGFQPDATSLAAALRSPWGHLSYADTSTRAVVELHWDLSEVRRLPTRALEEIWAGARPSAAGSTARVMRPGHEIPLLCAHMILRRQYATLRSLFDLHRVLLAADSAEAVVAREAAARWRLGPCTARALLRARELFDASLPGDLHEWTEDEASRDSLQARVARHALTPGVTDRPAGDLVDLVMNRNWSKLLICFPTPGALRERYGLAARQSVLPTYAFHVGRYVRKAPAELRRLWRAWRAVSVPPPLMDEAPGRAAAIRQPRELGH